MIAYRMEVFVLFWQSNFQFYTTYL